MIAIFALFLFEALLGHSHDIDGHCHGSVHPCDDIELSKDEAKKTGKINLKNYCKINFKSNSSIHTLSIDSFNKVN